MGKDYKAPTNRNPRDYYPTPWSMVEQLLEVEEFWTEILEPCCGEAMAISGYLEERGYSVEAYDLFAGKEGSRRDFLCENRRFRHVITNPPNRLADRFIETALRICDGKIAMLLPLDFLQGQGRYDKFFSVGFSPDRVHIFIRRPDFRTPLRDDGKYKTGSITYAWFIWTDGRSKNIFRSEFDYIDNREWILNEKPTKQIRRDATLDFSADA
jgi:hypothetical protein